MGMFDGVVGAIEGAVSNVEHAVSGVVQDVEADVQGAVQNVINFLFPGSAGSGGHAHDIYTWFHNGPGTGSYHAAVGTLAPVVTSMQGYTDHLNKAQQALSAGWQGSVADQAQQSFAPLTQNAQQVTTHADGLHTHLTDQINSFDTTKPKVVQVSPNAPSGPGLSDYASLLSPSTLVSGATNIASADASISQYQSGVQANQAAYTGYQGPTNGQTSGLPQNGNLTPGTGPGTPTPGPVGVGPVGVGFGSRGAGSGSRSSSNRYSGQYGNSGSAGNTAPSSTMPGVNQTNPWNPGQGSTNLSGYPGPGGASPVNAPGLPGGGGSSNPYGGSNFNSPGAGSAGFVGGGGGGFGGGSGGYGSRYGSGSSATGGGSRAGVGGLGAAEEEAAAGRAGMAGTKGASGMPGGSGAGRRGKGSEDAEHKTAAYLQEDDPDAIFGTDQKTVPPVIGL